MEIGDRVRIRPAGVSVFTIKEISDDGYYLIHPVGDAPGAYPFPMKREELIPAEQPAA